MTEYSTEIETTDEQRYAAIETGADETMIYDRENPDAWVQSSYTVEIGG